MEAVQTTQVLLRRSHISDARYIKLLAGFNESVAVFINLQLIFKYRNFA